MSALPTPLSTQLALSSQIPAYRQKLYALPSCLGNLPLRRLVCRQMQGVGHDVASLFESLASGYREQNSVAMHPLPLPSPPCHWGKRVGGESRSTPVAYCRTKCEKLRKFPMENQKAIGIQFSA